MASNVFPLFEPIRQELEEVEKALGRLIEESAEPLNRILNHALLDGKRLRPSLVILSGGLFGSCGSAGPILDLAVAVEVLHTATLIHDDIVDDARLRRGKPALQRRFPTGVSVLAGDLLLVRAISLVSNLDCPPVSRLFLQTIFSICEGEIEEALMPRKTALKEQSYFRVAELKTASLCSAACEMAATLSGGAQSHVKALQHFGRNLGIAFQIVDDVLDFTSDKKTLGKETGTDLRRGLVTLPAVYYLQGAGRDNPVSRYLSGAKSRRGLLEALRTIRSSGAIEASMAEARKHVDAGRLMLKELPESGPRETLLSLADRVVDRRF
ncbi:MAG TPA: polyprenyl synthetase family protein [Spirochaetia bacterium]|nr:polyprenyl synthetase family protein [Spirochaetia bacterium]